MSTNWRIAVVAALTSMACVALEDPDATSTIEEEVAAIGPEHTTAVVAVSRRSQWQYHDGGVDQGTGWRTGTGWAEGGGPFGYGEGYLSTIVSFGPDASAKHPTTYFRQPFTVGANVRAMFLRVMYDDGFVFYLNGREGGRARMPSGAVSFSTLSTGHEADNKYRTYDISSQIPNLRIFDLNWLAVEIHQASGTSSDLVFDAELIVVVDNFVDSVYAGGIPFHATWDLWDRGGDLGTAWRTADFDDSGWSAGPGPLGFGEQYVVTDTRAGPITTYFRTAFTTHGEVTKLTASVTYDDGFVAYLNGTEIARVGLPSGAITAATLASGHEAFNISEQFDWSAAVSLLYDDQPNTLAIEVHQVSASSSDLVFDLELRTHRGWRSQVSGTTERLRGVWFLDRLRGWVIGDNGTLRRTVDGGETWTAQDAATTEDLVGIQFVDDLHGRIVGDNGSIITTVDGGKTWSRGFFTTVFTGLSFVEPDLGWITADSPLIYRTVDGIAWDPTDTGTGGSFFGAERVDADHGWIIGLVPAEGGNWAAIHHSADGGETWHQQWTAGRYEVFLHDIHAVTASVAWAVGQSSLSGVGELTLFTLDGGATWTEAPATSNDVGLTAIEFVDPDAGFAVGHQGSIVHTRDGGSTWTVQVESRPDKPMLHDLHFADTTHGWAVGYRGTILHTTTAGQ